MSGCVWYCLTFLWWDRTIPFAHRIIFASLSDAACDVTEKHTFPLIGSLSSILISIVRVTWAWALPILLLRCTSQSLQCLFTEPRINFWGLDWTCLSDTIGFFFYGEKNLIQHDYLRMSKAIFSLLNWANHLLSNVDNCRNQRCSLYKRENTFGCCHISNLHPCVNLNIIHIKNFSVYLCCFILFADLKYLI